eukprot:6692615-Alexandrium_andersonii.AAC.1
MSGRMQGTLGHVVGHTLGRTRSEQGERHAGAHAESAEWHMLGRAPRNLNKTPCARVLTHEVHERTCA